MGACNSAQWEYGPYGRCSAQCGGGTASRTAICKAGSGSGPAQPDACNATLQALPLQRPCNPIPCRLHVWAAGAWGPCDKSCGGVLSPTLARLTGMHLRHAGTRHRLPVPACQYMRPLWCISILHLSTGKHQQCACAWLAVSSSCCLNKTRTADNSPHTSLQGANPREASHALTPQGRQQTAAPVRASGQPPSAPATCSPAATARLLRHARATAPAHRMASAPALMATLGFSAR